MNLSLRKTPNSRLLYREGVGEPCEWSSVWGELENFIARDPRIEKANQAFYIYFLESPEALNFESEVEFWSGVEIIGYPIDDLEEGWAFYDLDQGEIFCLEQKIKLDELKWSSLKDLAEKLYHQAQSEGGKIAKTWRLELMMEYRESRLDGWIDIQFFNEL